MWRRVAASPSGMPQVDGSTAAPAGALSGAAAPGATGDMPAPCCSPQAVEAEARGTKHPG